jgi:hypothetical protein
VSRAVRSLLAVLLGVGFVSLIVEFLEFTLVNAYAGARIADMGTYLAVRNEPMLLGAKLVYNTLAALLGGYITAKVAIGEEMPHAYIAAAVKSAAMIWGFTTDELAGDTPVWMMIALLATTGPGMVAGAWVRAQASRPGPVGTATKEQS